MSGALKHACIGPEQYPMGGETRAKHTNDSTKEIPGCRASGLHRSWCAVAVTNAHLMPMCVPISNLAATGGMPPKRSQATPFVAEEACLRY
jgi:hypothetical protein